MPLLPGPAAPAHSFQDFFESPIADLIVKEEELRCDVPAKQTLAFDPSGPEYGWYSWEREREHARTPTNVIYSRTRSYAY